MDKHRSDIDGLRAIAILPVVLYHAGLPCFSGGFIGVDVFFVISGYLITGVVARAIATGRFSLMGFYVRRAKRILPALFSVVSALFAFALFLMMPSELRNFGKMAAATSAFVSNIMLWRESGYFDVAAERKPLLMTWSLGVEEQFYIFWPLALVLASKWRRSLATMVGTLCLLSFCLACWEVATGSAAAFYLLPGRAWEILLGGALGLQPLPSDHEPRSESFSRHAASVVGLLLIAGPVLLLDKASAFPGWNAVPPCLGATLLLWSGERAVGNRHILSSPPLVAIGLISYSLYLWHWPLLTFVRIVNGPALPTGLALSVLALAVALSWLTWRFIETPCRQAPAPVPRATLERYSLLTAAVFCIGGFTYLAEGFPGRVTAGMLDADAARKDHNPLRGACLQDLDRAPGVSGADCLSRRPGQPVVAIWGDSHADAIAPGIRAWADRNGYGFLQLTAASCPPLPVARVVLEARVTPQCDRFNEHVTETLVANPAVTLVFLAARWAVYTENSRFGEDPGPMAYLIDGTGQELSSANSKRVFAGALAQVVATLTKSGKSVVLMGQTPEMGQDVPACQERNARLAMLGVDARHGRPCSVSALAVSKRLGFTNGIISQMALANGSVQALLPTGVLCGAEECRSTMDGIILYYDDDHVSAAGARYIVEHLDIKRP